MSSSEKMSWDQAKSSSEKMSWEQARLWLTNGPEQYNKVARVAWSTASSFRFVHKGDPIYETNYLHCSYRPNERDLPYIPTVNDERASDWYVFHLSDGESEIRFF